MMRDKRYQQRFVTWKTNHEVKILITYQERNSNVHRMSLQGTNGFPLICTSEIKDVESSVYNHE